MSNNKLGIAPISIPLLCDTCGENQFETYSDEKIECNICHRLYTKHELLELNTDSIQAGQLELQKEALKQAEKQLKKALKKWK